MLEKERWGKGKRHKPSDEKWAEKSLSNLSTHRQNVPADDVLVSFLPLIYLGFSQCIILILLVSYPLNSKKFS